MRDDCLLSATRFRLEYQQIITPELNQGAGRFSLDSVSFQRNHRLIGGVHDRIGNLIVVANPIATANPVYVHSNTGVTAIHFETL